LPALPAFFGKYQQHCVYLGKILLLGEVIKEEDKN